ncbi:MAG TPA: hypothetical protein VG013_15140 [Gemmataceae bacterium]|jgi:hypothetical protein|nr:hypothetical protein [Gemmataceae bacterium]
MTASRTRRIVLFAGAAGLLATVVAVAAIAIPIYIANDTANKAKACTAEYKTVQDGLNSYMAHYNVVTVPAATTNNMASPVKLSPAFVGNRTTVFAYTWDTAGRITVISAVAGGPFIPSGCVASG